MVVPGPCQMAAPVRRRGLLPTRIRALVAEVALVLLALALSACGGGGGGGGGAGTDTSGLTGSSISGSVGDGPVAGAELVFTDAHGDVVATVASDATARYAATLPAGTAFPVFGEATRGRGTDLVSGDPLEFPMLVIIPQPGNDTYNLNPLGTLIAHTAIAMSGPLTAQQMDTAKARVMATISLGFDTSLDPIKGRTSADNAAMRVKSSEAGAEVLRRLQTSLELGPDSYEATMEALAGDVQDGALDGQGGASSDGFVAAIANAVIGQVLMEAMLDELDAASLGPSLSRDQMNQAIATITAGTASPATTAGVPISREMIVDARAAVGAVQKLVGSSPVASALENLDAPPTGAQLADLSTAADPGWFDDAIAQISGTPADANTVNDFLRNLSRVTLRFTWDPKPDGEVVSGYRFYARKDSNPAGSNTLLFELVTGSPGFDPAAPSAQYNTRRGPLVIWKGPLLSRGDTVCVYAKAYNGAGESDPSNEACVTL